MIVCVCVCVCYLTCHDYPSLVEGESHGILLLYFIYFVQEIKVLYYPTQCTTSEEYLNVHAHNLIFMHQIEIFVLVRRIVCANRESQRLTGNY